MARKEKQEKKKSQKEINKENLESGIALINAHPLFGECRRLIRPATKNDLGNKTMCVVSSDGIIRVNIDYFLSPKQWAHVLAHNFLHLAFGHFDADKMPGYFITHDNEKKERKVECDIYIWNMACDIYITKFLADIKFGQSVTNDPMDILSKI